jgi:citronellol/citronellal dehydrogenase
MSVQTPTALNQRTVIITGASRGIGREIALACARRGANVVIAAKSAEPHPKLPGTIHSVAAEVEALGAKALAVQLDVREHEQVFALMQKTADTFGGIDIVINNAGAISLTNVENTRPNLYDRMLDINARAVYLTAHAALPFLKQSPHAHIHSLSPPLNLDPRWLKNHAPYTLSKYGMTLLSRGMAEEFKAHGIAVNCLWPRTIIATAAIEFALMGREAFRQCRTPAIMADAALAVLEQPASYTGHTLLDEEALALVGVHDFEGYRHDPSYKGPLGADLFLDDCQWS